MNIVNKVFRLNGLKLFDLRAFRDERGIFFESFKWPLLKAELSNNSDTSPFVQTNVSLSPPGVLRGLHFQRPPHSQGKWVTCLKGRIFDAVVDVRSDSPTFGQAEWLILDAADPQAFWIPRGFAHGFCVLGGDEAVVQYQVDALYEPKSEISLRFDDPKFQIPWPISNPKLSPKDAIGIKLEEIYS